MTRRHYTHWPLLESPLTAIAVSPSDRQCFFKQFEQWGLDMELPLYLWNAGYKYIQEIHSGKITPTPTAVEDNILGTICNASRDGIFLVEGIIQSVAPLIDLQLRNAHDALTQGDSLTFIVLFDALLDVPMNLYPLIPQLEKPFPSSKELEELVTQFCQEHPFKKESDPLPLLQACTGLPEGEITLVLNRLVGEANTVEDLADSVLEYAKQKLAGKGVRILPPPDVPKAAGLDLLDKDIDKIASLFDPRASSWKLRNPNGGLLWGLPGTGKSLVAKMIAQRIRAKMIAVDFNQLVGSTVSESLQNLKHLLDLADNSGNVVLFFDEFEKNFVGWESGGSGGAMAKMTGELLSWLQDHTTPVFMLATINRLGLLPAELVRRFKYVWFLGNPHNGALYEIFQIHLGKYCPNLRFTDSQWRILLDEYRGCSPDEIGKAVERTLETNFHHQVQSAKEQGKAFNPRKYLPQISLEDLLTERQNFTPASANKAISDQLYAIKQDADFARPTSGRDTSRFARINRGMFEQSGAKNQGTGTTKLNRQPKSLEVI
ncbi:AAA family ATPase [Okeania sp. SIO1I7]|uniref:AAA family ATPase n=1 Tax=Okeania sp. SIO1I7 TaxID=2607772 RepID=UPI0013F72EB9|nr:AAA family ATPase [Okeania sp. SIO1I7]NET30049.1 AAA family ATPase [Okeania sp. SIO1I7]